ncbi:MAG: two-component sensor histidine kinase [Methylococcaceae bacterium]|nr:two-component sensor histidine kinase [Methylococcaceae bacterium]
MTIRRTLLISYLLISLASALLIALMIFAHFRDVLRQEIEHKLESQAITIMQQIDTTLFERMQNMASWSHLEVMQEIRTRDVDKRLSQFLYELYAEYDGVYQQLYVVNQDNQVIAASHPVFIATQFHTSALWLQATLEQHVFSFDSLATLENLNISIPIDDAFQNKPLGRLYASFNWQEIVRLLNSFISEKSQDAIYYTLLVDAEGRVIATSSNLQNKIPPFFVLDEALLQQSETGALNYYAPFLEQEVLVGYSRAKGYRKFKGLDWRVLIFQSSDYAFAPILNVWHVLVLFVCLTLFLGTLVSLWMSAKISKPIAILAKSTGDFMAGRPTKFKPIKASTEISELNSQFTEMISNLEQSRLDVARVAKLAVIGEMAASMAHEVRTPLGILRSSAQILQREAQLSEIGLEMTEYILSETARLNELITTLLECARPRPPKFSLHDVQQIIEHVLELLRTKAEEKHISLELTFNHADVSLYCDRDQLIQVFLNLIMNAIQHVSEHGCIVIDSQIDNGFLDYMICDDGIGIPDDQKQTVFDPFYTQREEGIGLGLTVVQQIVLAHKGQIFITDNKQGGTCFHVQLPLEHRTEDS